MTVTNAKSSRQLHQLKLSPSTIYVLKIAVQ